MKANKSKWSTKHSLHEEKRAPGPYKQCVTPPRWYQVPRGTHWQETYLAQTHFCKMETTRNHPHQNVLVTPTKVKTLYKQQTLHIYINKLKPNLWNTTLGYGFHFRHRNSKTFPIESLANDSGCNLTCVEYGYPKGSQIPTFKVEIRHYSSQYSAHLSAHPNDLIINLIELPDNRQLQRRLPNDLPTRFLV
jgi:hypothetical protein